jgi:hypothetical protein
MKRIKYITALLLAGWFITQSVPVQAEIGDMGFFGGISEGRRLPRTTEQLMISAGARNARANNTVTLNYKELVFLGGRPSAELFEGLIDISQSGGVVEGNETGTYTVTFRVYPSANSNDNVTINRNAVFNVTYRVVGGQVIRNFDIVKTSWVEIIETPSGTFTLDPQLSSYNSSIIEDRTPGVSYYRGDVSGRLVYNKDNGAVLTADQSGSFYGYSCVWSSTETHRMSVSLMSRTDNQNDLNDNWGMQYEVRPSVTVNKVLQYTQNEPTAISFEGNYKEVLQNFAGLKYDIFIKPLFVWDEPYNGTASIEIVNTFEQLPEPDLSFLRGNAAEDDIRKLFAMQILTGEPRYYIPEQAITRGQFMTALARAIKLPIEEPPTAGNRTSVRNNRTPVTINLFSDVDSTRPEFPYIMAIQKAGIAYGRDNGMFYFDYPIQRQEAFTVMVRALGLTQMGLNPTVVLPFADSGNIAQWAIREVGVAHTIGLIFPDMNGNIYPQRYITKGEAASLLNYIIEYMRNGLVSDYADQIVNFAR